MGSWLRLRVQVAIFAVSSIEIRYNSPFVKLPDTRGSSMFKHSVICLFSMGLLSLTAQAMASAPAETNTATYFQTIQSDPAKLTKFLRAMPKGGDLHNHLSGATYAENMLRYAAKDQFCIDRNTFVVSTNPNCPSSDLLETAILDPEFKDQVIDAWSMRHFTMGSESGHDHFFNTFSKFGAIPSAHHGETLAEVSERAAEQNESYLELMTTADSNESGKLGKQLGYDANFERMRQNLLDHGFNTIITHVTDNLNRDESKMQEILACGKADAKPGCAITIHYLYQVQRGQAPEMVFAQLMAGFMAAEADARVVGLNMVMPEDGTISMQDYKLHMEMVKYFHTLYPNVHISLHAGELSNQLVTSDGLKFHIHDAVMVASANRIGHGVDVANEEGMQDLLTTMALKKILVEINLTSNRVILNVAGKDHPLNLYLQNNVPVALSTDDEGVSRSNLTKEYVEAVTDFNLPYLTLKHMVRNSLHYSFAAGSSLWVDDGYQEKTSVCRTDNADCNAFLNANPKARLEWDLEQRFNVFENQYVKSE